MRANARNGRSVFALWPRPPLDVDLTLQRYRLWGVDPANVYREGAFYRVASIDGARVPFRLAATGSREQPGVTVAFAGPDTVGTRARLRREVRALLGLGADLAGFSRQVGGDPVLGPLLLSLRGLRPTLAPDPFELLVTAITAQQVNLTFALTVRARLIRRFGEPTTLGGVTVYAFPGPVTLASADVPALRAMQFTTRKAEFVIGLARAVTAGELDLGALASAPDDEVIRRLTAIRGLGRWTAEWFLARGLGRPDVCPAGDLGVRRAFGALCFGGRDADEVRIRRRALTWRPYRSLAVHYLLAGHRLAGQPAAAAAPGPAPAAPASRWAGVGGGGGAG